MNDAAIMKLFVREEWKSPRLREVATAVLLHGAVVGDGKAVFTSRSIRSG